MTKTLDDLFVEATRKFEVIQIVVDGGDVYVGGDKDLKIKAWDMDIVGENDNYAETLANVLQSVLNGGARI